MRILWRHSLSLLISSCQPKRENSSKWLWVVSHCYLLLSLWLSGKLKVETVCTSWRRYPAAWIARRNAFYFRCMCVYSSHSVWLCHCVPLCARLLCAILISLNHIQCCVPANYFINATTITTANKLQFFKSFRSKCSHLIRFLLLSQEAFDVPSHCNALHDAQKMSWKRL